MPQQPLWVIADDLNLDGNLDLVTSNADNSISVLLGNGDGTFQSAVSYAVSNTAFQVAAGDFNGDGIPDLAVTNSYSNTVSILIGNGDGTFQPHVDYPVGNIPFGVVIGDFNADGVLDLGVSNTDCASPASNCPGTVSILLGNGDGTFQPQVAYPVGLYPVSLAEANLSGEGGAGLAVPNAASNTVSIMLNLPVIGIFPNTLNFGSETVGVKSSALTITIGNPSGTPISITGKPKISGADAPDFAETTTCPLKPSTLAAGAQCSISVTFDPKASGTRSATLSLKDSVPGSPQAIALGGTGN